MDYFPEKLHLSPENILNAKSLNYRALYCHKADPLHRPKNLNIGISLHVVLESPGSCMG